MLENTRTIQDHTRVSYEPCVKICTSQQHPPFKMMLRLIRKTLDKPGTDFVNRMRAPGSTTDAESRGREELSRRVSRVDHTGSSTEDDTFHRGTSTEDKCIARITTRIICTTGNKTQLHVVTLPICPTEWQLVEKLHEGTRNILHSSHWLAENITSMQRQFDFVNVIYILMRQ